MKRIYIIIILLSVSLINYGQIIADHRIVDDFDNIPQTYINEIKKMWLVYAGESHSIGFRYGLWELEGLNPVYNMNAVNSGTPEGYTTSYLRVSGATWGDYSNATGWQYWYGEEDWWTNATALSRTKAGISYAKDNGLTISALGFGWCYDAIAGSASSGTDPVYGCHWYGWSEQGPSGDKPWGINDADNSVSGNSINMDTYLSATQSYIDYCIANSIPTKVFFTTGPVDYGASSTDEAMYQGYLKYEYIRDYVKANPSRILFDYADILCYDDNGSQTTKTWNGHTFPVITTTNLGSADVGHIGSAGRIRLAKAMWWMLARMAGWDGIITGIEKENESSESINVTVDNNLNQIKITLSDYFISGQLSLYNLQGNLIDKKNIDNTLSIINTSTVSPGIYLVMVTKANFRATKKIIVLN